MNIARELGNLLSGLLGPQAPAATRQTGTNLQEHSRTPNRNNQRTENPADASMARDRITLSSASRSLLEKTQAAPARTDAEPSSQRAQHDQPLALPYLSDSVEQINDIARSSASAGIQQQAAVAESPATRQLVRTAYGNPASKSNDNAPPARQIDLRA